MTPQSRVLPHSLAHPAVRYAVYAEDQPEYLQLPCLKSSAPEGRITTRWKLTWRERFEIFLSGDLWLQVLTFHKPLQPVKLMTEEPCPEDCL